MKTVIEGIIVPTAPLHISSGEGGVRLNTDTFRKVYGQNAGGITLTTTQHQLFITGENESLRLPVINANTLRGGIRRAATRVACRILSARNEMVTLNTVIQMNNGTSSGRPSSDIPTLEDLDAAFANPFVGLFGGGERMLRSRMKTTMAMPVVEPLIGLGAIPDRFHAMDEAARLSSCSIFRRVDDFTLNTSALDPVIPTVVEEFESTVTERIMESVVARQRKKDGKAAPKDSNMVDSINAIEYINPGTRMYIRFEVNGGDHHLGMFLKALEEFYHANAIGGSNRNGFGEFQFIDLHARNEKGLFKVFEDKSRSLCSDVADFLVAFDQTGEDHLRAEELEALLK